MIFLLDSYDMSMGFLWDPYRQSMIFLLDFYDIYPLNMVIFHSSVNVYQRVTPLHNHLFSTHDAMRPAAIH